MTLSALQIAALLVAPPISDRWRVPTINPDTPECRFILSEEQKEIGQRLHLEGVDPANIAAHPYCKGLCKQCLEEVRHYMQNRG